MAAIGAYSQRMIASGKVVLTGGLVRPTRGIQIRCESGKGSVTDGPFAETKELIDGFALVEVKSKEEAIALSLSSCSWPVMGSARFSRCSTPAALRRRSDEAQEQG